MSNIGENKFYRQEADGSLTLIKVEQVELADPIAEKEAKILKMYEELEALKAQRDAE